MKNWKRFASFLMAFIMIVQMLPFNALAVDEGWSSVTSDTIEGETYHTVTFMVDGSPYATQYVQNGEKLVLPEAPSKGQNKFIGWVAGTETTVTAVTTVTADMTVVAVFEEIKEFTVTVKYIRGDTGEEIASRVTRHYSSEDGEDTIASPASVDLADVGLVYPEQAEVKIEPSKLTESQTIEVKYYSANAVYTVHHRVSGADDDESDLASE